MNKRFNELCKLEHGLLQLYREAQSVKDDGKEPAFCANQWWHRDFKPRLIHLVGWRAANPAIQSQEDYDVAYKTIWRTLPDCRHPYGWCLWG